MFNLRRVPTKQRVGFWHLAPVDITQPASSPLIHIFTPGHTEVILLPTQTMHDFAVQIHSKLPFAYFDHPKMGNWMTTRFQFRKKNMTTVGGFSPSPFSNSPRIGMNIKKYMQETTNQKTWHDSPGVAEASRLHEFPDEASKSKALKAPRWSSFVLPCSKMLVVWDPYNGSD